MDVLSKQSPAILGWFIRSITITDVEPVPPPISPSRKSRRALNPAVFANSINGSDDFVRRGVMDHMALTRHVAKCARAELAVQTCGVLVSLDNTIIRSSDQMHRNIQLIIVPAQRCGGV